MRMHNKVVGEWGENQAVRFLERHGFFIIERNFRTLRGEIDIVAKKGSDYYFIEVKTREYGPWARDEAITPFKKMRVSSAVRAFLAARRVPGDVGIVQAGLLVGVNRGNNKVWFRLAVYIC